MRLSTEAPQAERRAAPVSTLLAGAGDWIFPTALLLKLSRCSYALMPLTIMGKLLLFHFRIPRAEQRSGRIVRPQSVSPRWTNRCSSFFLRGLRPARV